MKFSKIFKDQLDHCYAIMRMNAKGRDFLVVASEEAQPCYAYDLDNDFARTTVWPNVGGTMTMVQIPDTLNFWQRNDFILALIRLTVGLSRRLGTVRIGTKR